jgi:lipoprotein-anchoring transpeptidase ErfK/SrfK
MRRSIPLSLTFLALSSLLSHAQDAAPAPADLAAEPSSLEEIVRVQVFLDQRLFGPGKIDGAIGTFTRQAIAAFNHSIGHPPASWAAARSAAAQEFPVIYAAYQIHEDDLAFVNTNLPQEPELQAALPYMAYRSTADFVAERYHTDTTFLAKINGHLKLDALKPGDLLRVPNVRPFRIEQIPKSHSYPEEKTLSRHHIIIDTSVNHAYFYDAQGALIAAFPITPGEERFIPRGDWKIVTMVSSPTFRYDKKMLQEGVRSNEFHLIPPGPRNPVGIIWAGLNKSGIGLHGSADPRTIGRARSAGCVRFSNWDAARLPTLARPGTTVEIR